MGINAVYILKLSADRWKFALVSDCGNLQRPHESIESCKLALVL